MKILSKNFFTHYSLLIAHYFRRRRVGFTLIEILVVMTLMAVVIATAGGLFIYSIRMDQKTRAILNVKQIGDNAISTMINKIRQTEVEPTICLVSPTSSNTINVIIDDSETIITCSADGIRLGADNNLISDGLAVEGFGSCFTCYADTLGQPAIVEINFTLSKGSGGDPQRDVSLDFMTSISLRNY